MASTQSAFGDKTSPGRHRPRSRSPPRSCAWFRRARRPRFRRACLPPPAPPPSGGRRPTGPPPGDPRGVRPPARRPGLFHVGFSAYRPSACGSSGPSEFRRSLGRQSEESLIMSHPSRTRVNGDRRGPIRPPAAVGRDKPRRFDEPAPPVGPSPLPAVWPADPLQGGQGEGRRKGEGDAQRREIMVVMTVRLALVLAPGPARSAASIRRPSLVDLDRVRAVVRQAAGALADRRLPCAGRSGRRSSWQGSFVPPVFGRKTRHPDFGARPSRRMRQALGGDVGGRAAATGAGSRHGPSPIRPGNSPSAARVRTEILGRPQTSRPRSPFRRRRGQRPEARHRSSNRRMERGEFGPPRRPPPCPTP